LTRLSAEPGAYDKVKDPGDTYGSNDTFTAASVAFAATLQALDQVIKVGRPAGAARSFELGIQG
jgi:hypothetical protein